MSAYMFAANTADVNGSIKRNEGIKINPVSIKLLSSGLDATRSELGEYYIDFYRRRSSMTVLPKLSSGESIEDRKIYKLVNSGLFDLYFGTMTKYAAVIKIGTLRMYTNKGLSKKESPYYELEYTDKTPVPFEAQVYLGYDLEYNSDDNNSDNADGIHRNKYFVCDGDVIIGICTTSEKFKRLDSLSTGILMGENILFTKTKSSMVSLTCSMLDVLVGDKDDFRLLMSANAIGNVSFYAHLPSSTGNDVIVPYDVYQCDDIGALKLFNMLFGHDGVDVCIASAMSNKDTVAFTVHSHVTLSSNQMNKISYNYYIKIGNNEHALIHVSPSWDESKEKGNCYRVGDYLTIRIPVYDVGVNESTHLRDMCFALDMDNLSKRELDILDKYINNNKECKMVAKPAGDVIFGTPHEPIDLTI